MRTKLASFLACLIPALIAGADVSVTIDPAARRQTIDGFGTCLAWWMEKPYSEPEFREMYYRDLGCSILRMELHPNALPVEVNLSDDIEQNIRLFKFGATGVSVFGEFARAGKDLKLDELKLIGSLWTPPHWMKSGAVLNKEGQSCGGKLKTDEVNLAQFARYVAAYVKGFEQKYGVPIYALSIQNELRFKEPYNSCQYTPAEYAVALAAVGNEFRRCGIETKLIGPEDVGVGPASNDFFLKQQMSFIQAARQNDDAWQSLEILAIHGYAGDGVSPVGSSNEMWSKYWSSIRSFARRSWQTECSGHSTNWSAKGKDGERGALAIAISIHEALVKGNVSAWLYWQLSDGKRTSPQTLTHEQDTSSAKYVSAKHFFRFVRPGMVRVEARSSDDGVLCSAFVNEQAGTQVIVLINTTEREQQTVLRCPEKWLEAMPVVKLSDDQKRLADLPADRLGESSLRISLPARSVATVVCGG